MLTTKERAFCQAYSETGDAAAAYRRAFRSGRLKDVTIETRAAALLARESVAALLTELGRAGRLPASVAVPGERNTCADEPAGHGPEERRGTETASAAVDRTWVLRCLVLNVERALQLVPTRERASAGASMAYNGAVANRALELIGKELGMFVDRREVRAGPLADKSDDELNALIRRLLEEAGLARNSPSQESAEPGGGPSTGSGPDAMAP